MFGTAHGYHWPQDQRVAEWFPTSQHFCSPWFGTRSAQFPSRGTPGVVLHGKFPLEWGRWMSKASREGSSSKKDFVERRFWFLLPLEPFPSSINNLSHGCYNPEFPPTCPMTTEWRCWSARPVTRWDNDDPVALGESLGCLRSSFPNVVLPWVTDVLTLPLALGSAEHLPAVWMQLILNIKTYR